MSWYLDLDLSFKYMMVGYTSHCSQAQLWVSLISFFSSATAIMWFGYPCCLLPGSSTRGQTAGPPWWKMPTSIIHLDLSNSLPPIICQRYSFTTVWTYNKIYLFSLPFGYTNLFFSETVYLMGERLLFLVRRCEDVMRMYLIYGPCFYLPFVCCVLSRYFPKEHLIHLKYFIYKSTLMW